MLAPVMPKLRCRSSHRLLAWNHPHLAQTKGCKSCRPSSCLLLRGPRPMAHHQARSCLRLFLKQNNGIILVHAAVVGVHHTVAHKPSGMVSIAVPPPATPVRTTHGLASPDSVVLPSSPGAPPHLHARAAPAAPQQKSRVTFEGDSPRGDAASSGTGGLCASAAAQQEQPLQQRSAISLPDRAGKEVPPTRQYRSLWVLAGPTYNACADSHVAGQSRQENTVTLSPQLQATYSRLRAAVATCTAMARARGVADDLTQVFFQYACQQPRQGWVTLGFTGDTLYWRDTVLNNTTWRGPGRPASV